MCNIFKNQSKSTHFLKFHQEEMIYCTLDHTGFHSGGTIVWGLVLIFSQRQSVHVEPCFFLSSWVKLLNKIKEHGRMVDILIGFMELAY